MLTLTDPAGTNLSGVAINAGVVSGNTNLKIGDTINLLTNSNDLITTSGTIYGTLTEGVSKNYEMSIEPSGNSIVANITKSPNTLNPETKVLSESVDKTTTGAITTSLDTPTIENIIDIEPEINIVTNSVSKTTSRSTSTSMDTSKIENTGGNTENEEGSTTVQESANAMVVDSKGWEIFANMGGGSLRIKGSNGSHVDRTTQSINLGFARSLQSSAGKFTIAPIIDYVSGNYDSYLETGIHGNGKTRYIAGGLIARRMLPNGFYYEGSFRVGKVKTDFASDNIDKTGFFGRVTYDTSATTLSGHLKLGKAFRLNHNNFLDVYGIYYHAHQGSMEADLSSGEHYNFSSADAGRFRIGYRFLF